SQFQRRCGLRCQCPPSSARQPLQRLSITWIVTCKGPAATIPPMHIYCAAWSAAASVDSRAGDTRCTPAIIITSTGEKRVIGEPHRNEVQYLSLTAHLGCRC